MSRHRVGIPPEPLHNLARRIRLLLLHFLPREIPPIHFHFHPGNSLFRVMGAHQNLECLQVWKDPRIGRRHPLALIEPCPVLATIQRNTSVQSVVWRDLIISSEDISTFLDAASSVKSLEINKCRIEPSDGDRELDRVGRLLQRNKNIRYLKLNALEHSLLRSILQSLVSNTSVRTLHLANIFSTEETSQVLRHLLKATKSIRRIHLSGGAYLEETFEAFAPIAQGLIASQSISKITFSSGCRLGSVRLFKEILRTKLNLRSLTIGGFAFPVRWQTEGAAWINEGLAPALLRPHSSLRFFAFRQSHHIFGRSLPIDAFHQLLKAIEKSRLRGLSIGVVGSQQLLDALTHSIPVMNCKDLNVLIGV